MPQMSLQNKILCISFGIFLVLYLYLNRNAGSEKQKSAGDPVAADTYIPPGQVLVPIQIENSESLNAVMGPFAIADLYAVSSGHNTLVAEKVKLIRAPLNPQQFAVLVSDSLSRTIMQSKTSFSVVLQNRSVFKADLEKNLLAESENSTAQGNRKVASRNLNSAPPDLPPPVPKPAFHRIEIEYQQKKSL
jgi:hypothetical protein